jgi:hypothetical protein
MVHSLMFGVNEVHQKGVKEEKPTFERFITANALPF